MHKKRPLQKTEDEQIKSLVERKGAFSAGRIWMTFGFKLMGSKVTFLAQAVQIQAEKDAVARVAAKKEEDNQVKVEKANPSFKLFKAGEKMSHEAWIDIMGFLVPFYNTKTRSSQLSIVKKVLDKIFYF